MKRVWKDGRCGLTVDNNDGKFAMIADAYDELPLAVWEGGAKYHRCSQFGGDPGFYDVWSGTDEQDEMLEVLLRVAILTEIDLVMMGYAFERKPEDMKLPINPERYDQEMLEFVRSNGVVDFDMTGGMSDVAHNFLLEISENAARRVARSLSILF